MTLYVDSSAMLKRYVDEHDSGVAIELMKADPVLVTCRVTEVEVRRNLAWLLTGDDLDNRRRAFADDLDGFALVNLDAQTCHEASRIAEETLCRSIDSLHLAAARRAGRGTTVLTFDNRQARAARTIGLDVVGT